VGGAFLVLAFSLPASGQSPATAGGDTQGPPAQAEQHNWYFMQDGVIFATYTHQGGVRGSSDFGSQNWWMGMAYRPMGRVALTLTGMVSLEPATIAPHGFAEIFQVGETYKHVPNVDHQHPHDFLMQASAVIRVALTGGTALRIVLAPVGEAGIGPPAFMHRRSAAENPIAPLSHHTFDSTHVTMGVVGLGLDAGALSVDGAVFHGAEPDEQRWDLMDPGPLDSWSTRIRFRPTREWDVQGSYAFVKQPEILEKQDVRRESTSISYTHEEQGSNYTALTFAAGRNRRRYNDTDALLGEITQRVGRTSIFGRYEGVEVETEHLLFPGFIHKPHPGELTDPLHTVAMGGAFDITEVKGWELAVGGEVVLYKVPLRLQETHGERPVSFYVFMRLRVPKSPMGRMWNTMMADGMRH
jgi:hypothetical protein